MGAVEEHNRLVQMYAPKMFRVISDIYLTSGLTHGGCNLCENCLDAIADIIREVEKAELKRPPT